MNYTQNEKIEQVTDTPEKLKAEMLHIEGKRIKNQYMKRLGITAMFLSALVGGAMCILFHLLKK